MIQEVLYMYNLYLVLVAPGCIPNTIIIMNQKLLSNLKESTYWGYPHGRTW